MSDIEDDCAWHLFKAHTSAVHEIPQNSKLSLDLVRIFVVHPLDCWMK